jgi:hypothetical protein
VRNEAERVQVLAQTDYLGQVRRYQQVVEQFTDQTPAVMLCWLNDNGQIYLQTDELLWARSIEKIAGLTPARIIRQLDRFIILVEMTM